MRYSSLSHLPLMLGFHAQVCGSIVGSLLASALVPGASVNMGVGGPGCFDPTTIHPDITLKQLFGWVRQLYAMHSLPPLNQCQPSHAVCVCLSLLLCTLCPRLLLVQGASIYLPALLALKATVS